MLHKPEETALLLLDLQNEMVSPEGKIGGGGLAAVVEQRDVIAKSAAALDAARQRGLHIVHVRLGFKPDYSDALSQAPRIARLKENRAAILGEWGTEWPDELSARVGEHKVAKQAVNPFFNTGLLEWLRARDVKHLILAGVVTNLVVEMSARYADDAGFVVTVLEDCCAAPNAEWHAFSVEKIMPMFGTVTNSDALISGELV